ncbi:hypothetical protein [Actinoplanes palleronii]|uniref:Uncharacterized protein n=1 Tax=Actinoplanes palleronii TaxID=113570 RepID=A0ABQ4BKA3_9ACTN|nr:hypothetical protein [Actinoplanes palleronii]GIE70721.1 hypothetical protein Apa02nite_068290 [Actinoplanes palleronii]
MQLPIVPRYVGLQYLGTQDSADDLLAAAQAMVLTSTWTLVAVGGTSLTLHEVGEWSDTDWIVPTGSWLIVAPVGVCGLLDDTTFRHQYQPVATVEEG